nr:hypothetical protein [Granulosicoccus sp.]
MSIFKLSPKNLGLWAVTREGGKKRFQFFWTVWMTLIVFVINVFWNHRDALTLEFPFADTRTLISIGFLLLVYPVCFYIAGSYVWNKTEQAYQQQINEKTPR